MCGLGKYLFNYYIMYVYVGIGGGESGGWEGGGKVIN